MADVMAEATPYDAMDQQEPVAPASPKPKDEAPDSKRNKKIAKFFKKEIDASIREIDQRIPQWKRNVEARLGDVGTDTEGVDTDGITVQAEINPDWALTKTKTANLFSQVPRVRLQHENDQYAAALYPFQKELNYELGEKRANVGVAMEEALNDVVNAAGVAIVYVAYEARFQEGDVPTTNPATLPPAMHLAALQSGKIPTEKADVPVEQRFTVTRLSPDQALWPKRFRGSNFDNAPWVGYRGKKSWADAKHDFNLKDADKDTVVGAHDSKANNKIQDTNETGVDQDHLEEVSYKDLYYWRHMVDADEMSFKSIWRLVYVDGLDEPAIHEPWAGQKYSESGHYVGSCKFPVRYLTLTYITDNPVPPSDTEAGAPQVADMRRSREQMFANRKFSTPMRWFDSNRIGPEIRDSLMDGTYQGMIPTQGDGSRSIGEVARASYPAEDLAFDRQNKADLMETWQISPAQSGVVQQGERTKAETELVQANFQTRIGQERARVASFFLGIAEVMAGLLALYSDFPSLDDQERQRLEQVWDRENVLHDIVFSILPESTIILDVEQQIQRTMRLLNMTAMSGMIDPSPLVAELIELHGKDPAQIMKQPTEKKPEPPNISFRFAGKEDIMNPAVMGILIEQGLAPKPESIKGAKALLTEAAMPLGTEPPTQPQQGPMGPGAGGAGGGPQPENPSQPHPQDTQRPSWELAPKVASRSADMGQV